MCNTKQQLLVTALQHSSQGVAPRPANTRQEKQQQYTECGKQTRTHMDTLPLASSSFQVAPGLPQS
jgi:hypothetical protein